MQQKAATAGRTGNALPPVMTHRSGLVARLELWLKRALKRATHWFTWEQVNFNSTVSELLQEVVQRLATHEEQIGHHEERLTRDAREFGDALAVTHTRLDELSPQIEQLVHSLLTRDVEQLRAEHGQQLARLLEEQRVSFRQLQLQIGEIGTTADRAQRNAQLRLDEIRSRLEELRALESEVARLTANTRRLAGDDQG